MIQAPFRMKSNPRYNRRNAKGQVEMRTIGRPPLDLQEHDAVAPPANWPADKEPDDPTAGNTVVPRPDRPGPRLPFPWGRPLG